jgi:TonB family protein
MRLSALLLGAPLFACAHHGPLDGRTIDRVVRRQEGDIRACYDIGLSRDAGLAGTMRLDFTIEPSGATTAATVSESTLEHPQVEQCIVDIVSRWRFPSSDVKTDVGYPLAFAPEEDLDAPPTSP